MALLLGNGVAEKAILAQIQWGITWITFALIVMGVIGTLIKRKEMLSAPLWGDSQGWLPLRLETEFFLLVLVSCGILAGSLAAPFMKYSVFIEK